MTAKKKNSNSETPNNCLLYSNGCADRQGKAESFCKRCGWDKNECQRRKQKIRDGGLQKDKYGYKRLVIEYEAFPKLS